MPKQKIVIANWKMKLSLNETLTLAKKMKRKFVNFKDGEVVICPDFVSLANVKKVLKKILIKLGAQNVFWESAGAYTGEISPLTLKQVGCSYVIVGHSERREYLAENYEIIHKKIKAVLDTVGLTPIICVGESWDERKTDRRDFVLVDQIQQSLSGIKIIGPERIIIAYEPIWAVDSDVAIEPSEAEYAHKIIKLTLNEMFGMKIVNDNFKIIYGGSIDSKNVKSFADLENLDGVLVGAASLDAEEFYKVAKAITK